MKSVKYKDTDEEIFESEYEVILELDHLIESELPLYPFRLSETEGKEEEDKEEDENEQDCDEDEKFIEGFYDIRDKKGVIFKDKHVIGLSLKDTGLNQLPDSIVKLIELKYLDLSSNKFSLAPKMIKSLEKLIFLNFSSNILPTYKLYPSPLFPSPVGPNDIKKKIKNFGYKGLKILEMFSEKNYDPILQELIDSITKRVKIQKNSEEGEDDLFSILL